MCAKVCRWRNREKLQKLYDECKDKIENELNLIKLIKTMKLLKIVLRNSLFTETIEYEAQHSNKCTIDIDGSDEDTDEE